MMKYGWLAFAILPMAASGRPLQDRKVCSLDQYPLPVDLPSCDDLLKLKASFINDKELLKQEWEGDFCQQIPLCFDIYEMVNDFEHCQTASRRLMELINNPETSNDVKKCILEEVINRIRAVNEPDRRERNRSWYAGVADCLIAQLGYENLPSKFLRIETDPKKDYSMYKNSYERSRGRLSQFHERV